MVSPFSNALLFIKEVIAEVKKIVWPTRSELFGASVVVCIFAAVCAMLFGAMDSAFAAAVRYIIAG